MTHRFAFIGLLCLAGGLLLTEGCTALRTRIGTPIDPARIPASDASTHYRDILKTLGPPQRMSTCGENLLFLYEYTFLREDQLGFGFDFDWVRLFKLTFGKAHARRQAALLIFDEAGFLRAGGFREWTEDLGDGTSVQLIVSLIHVVDTEEFEVDAYQHRWGATLLEPLLPTGLNRQNSMESGQSGLEQLATPLRAGQHTLEQ